MKDYKIIDIHIHPHIGVHHKSYLPITSEDILTELKHYGYYKTCGSVVNGRNLNPTWEYIKDLNDEALKLRDFYEDFYIPGFHIHPNFVKESIEEVERMHNLGVNLVGEIVPYLHGWSFRNADKNLYDILEACDHYKMIVDIHAIANDEETHDKMDEMVSRFKNMAFIGAHPHEGYTLERAFKRMEKCDNYYLDWSGGGLFRHGTLRHAIDLFGKERQLFGTDYTLYNVGMYVGAVAFDFLLSEEEKEYVFHKNACRLLGLEEKI